MSRSRGDAPRPGRVALLSAACLCLCLCLLPLCSAGPLGPLPNVTIASSDVGLKDGGCLVGDVVYAVGEEFPGAGACERCACARPGAGGVRCARVRCQPRAGCKALHRPDQCCPTYQCECEQEGRVYGNGEKLVDPADPCRVCYCQGGEVVCRRIACFVRDDCRPRLVPGRCCPEYDNCPLRGVTAIPGVAPSMSSMSTIDDVASSPVPAAPKENVKQEITIKEITPVSEIPVITEVKIKEILPSPNIEVAEYSSSKSPLIVREATSEKTNEADSYSKTESPITITVQPSSPSILISSAPSETTKSSETSAGTKKTNDLPPSKISLTTQDSINSEIYPSILTSIPTMGFPSITPDVIPIVSTTKAPIIEEEDPSLFEHNPAFPPLPDDLSVPGNHEDESAPEQTLDGEHVSTGQEVLSVASVSPSTEAVIIKEPLPTISKDISAPTQQSVKVSEISIDVSTVTEVSTIELDTTLSTERTGLKASPMLNLRSAIPTEILNAPSYVPEEINGELDDVAEMITVAEEHVPIITSTVTKPEEKYTEKLETPTETKMYPRTTLAVTDADTATTTTRPIETAVYVSSSQVPQEQSTSSVFNSNIATEITLQTELSSLPIETSDQNPHEISKNLAKEEVATATIDPSELATTKVSSPIESEVITISKAIPNTDNKSLENVETTEFIVTSFGSSESATDAVELIKISADPEENAAVIEPVERKKNNVLTDLINLVGDVASIGDHTDSPSTVRHVTASTSISDSEELIPVNAGYKSKNSNWNVNSITEMPVKSKNQLPVNKQKVVEIEGDDTDSITDSPPPYDKVEPTTRRPIIDNVSDNMPENKTGNKDIEIITKSYVPTINRRPTKVVMKKNNERPIFYDKTTEDASVSVSSEVATESTIALSSESTSTVEAGSSTVEGGERIVESTVASSTVSQ